MHIFMNGFAMIVWAQCYWAAVIIWVAMILVTRARATRTATGGLGLMGTMESGYWYWYYGSWLEEQRELLVAPILDRPWRRG